MKFATILKSLLVLTVVSLLAACGGGTSGGDSAFQPASWKISATPTANSVQSGSFINVAVKVTQANGANVADGTTVNSAVSPAANGAIFADLGGGNMGGPSGSTVGGVANFYFVADGPGGSTTLTFSVVDPATPNRALSTTVTVNVTPPPPPPDLSWRISAEATTTTLAAHTSADVTVRVTRADGSLVPDGTLVNATTIPASSGSIDESATTVGGVARFTYTAGGSAGTSTARFSTTDPENPGETITADVVFTITEGGRYLIEATAVSTELAAYTSTDVTVTVKNADGSQVPDGTIVSAITAPSGSGSVAAVDGGTTIAGIARFTFTAGGNAGTSTATFSVADPDDPGQTSKVDVVFTITEGASLLIDIEPAATVVRMQSRTDVTVRVRTAEGAIVPDGTVVNAVVVPDSRGLVIGTQSNAPNAATVGGVASFAFISGNQAGTAAVEFSVVHPESGEVVTRSTSFTISAMAGRRMAVTMLPGTIPLNGRSDIKVEVFEADGRPVADGTVINAIAFPGSYGELDQESSETLAGIAVFQYQAQSQAGSVDLVFSATTVDAEDQHVVGRSRLLIVPTDDARLKLDPVRTTLPVNHFAVDPFLGSPYMAEVTITVKDSNGQPENCTRDDACLTVSVNPVGNTGGFTTLDDPETDDINEFLVRMGQAPVGVVAGKATVFVHALHLTGSTTLTVTYIDRVSNTTIAAAQEFEIIDATPPTPSALVLTQLVSPVYAQGSGGNDSTILHVELLDAIHQPVPDPVEGTSAHNNYRLEVIGANPDEGPRLSGIDAAGNSVSGPQVDLRTTAGIGAVNLISGEGVGSFRLRLTADRADNNIDNGIADPVVLERSVVISDGQLWDIEITRPTVNNLTVNPATGDIDVEGELQIPMDPDGTYSLTVGVIATDRLGNPVLPGTVINFGLVDEPQDFGVGDFYMAGGDGDAEEGGTLFTAESGCFTVAGCAGRAGGGAGPGDTLLILSEDVVGNRDLEGARTVIEVHNRRSLSVNYRFNHNDTTGQSVDYKGILPYIVGRAADGNILARAETNALGVATTKMNYPVSKLGKVVAIWAQGDGPLVAGQPKKVADVEFARFAGVAGESARLVVSPNVLPANTTLPVTVCVYDALNAPMGGLSVDFAFQALSGTGKVDGQPTAGTVAGLTEFGSGCTVAEVSTSGMLEDQGGTQLVFSSGGLADTVSFTFQTLVLQARPGAMLGSGGGVMLTLLDGSGHPQPGFQIFGTCTSSGGATVWIERGPGITDADGRTTAVISAQNLNQIKGSGSGECTFFTADESATATVTLEGQDMCKFMVSPAPPGCDDPEPDPEPTNFKLSASLRSGSVLGNYSLISSPAGVACSAPGGSGTVDCADVEYEAGTVVSLTTVGPATGIFQGWSGDCVGDIGNPQTATVVMSSDRTCEARWSTGPVQEEFTLTIQVSVGVGMPIDQYTVWANPPGIEACTNFGTAGTTVTCTLNYPAGTSVSLSTITPAGATFRGWAGACDPGPVSPPPTAVNVVMDGNRSCMATWE